MLPSLGLQFPLRDISCEQRCDTERPSLDTLYVLGVLHALDVFRRPQPCEFVSPHCHVQDSPTGVFSPRAVVDSSSLPAIPSRRLR